ncbi:MAG: hypothetical protein AAF744_08400 [Pseudomonadota bacterium]
MGNISIWRWAVEDDLDAFFARLVRADDAEVAAIAAEVAAQEAESLPSLDQIEAETEAKLRGMKLPADIMKTMLRGFKNSMQEAREEEARAATEEEEFDPMPGPNGRVGLALASSHMFYEDPYASLGYEEIEGQVNALLARYGAAISKAVGHPGQTLPEYLGLAEDALWEDAVFDILVEPGLDAVMRMWITGDLVLYLGQWHEDKELPIDLEFNRVHVALFEGVKAQVAALRHSD